MAKIIDTDVTEQEDNSTEFASLAEEETTEAQQAAPEVAPEEEVAEAPAGEESNEEELPEKYRGKSAAELARMHQNLEQLMGKQSSEVGELRKAVDSLVQQSMQAQSATATSAPEPDVDDSDFFTDPKGTVERLIAQNPTLQSAQQVAAEMSKQQALSTLKNAHPDMDKILGDEQFKQWVGASKIRSEMFAKADQQYDFEQANELFSLWKERAQVVKQTKAVEKLEQKRQLKKASTGSARANPEGKAVKKVYRRRDIIDLMNRDPKRYQAMQSEIMQAYAEGRVK
jgi:hypothetical protein